ncbi:uroporphyrinogen-III synthase [Candidatus Methanoperedens nitroreducens]|uniref:Uroporphyrinogen-III synthase n=1 Tax=Candidatus Methanoperedens nitratireducens TaxID=1392998 RepID=A0A062VBM6_9EURY|nr:uroporphyrinogen-III synthase [Candidatus Methanoperedens nitroreducens]KCZ72710.1 uroporphyrinogen-III synthase [Candidatus Methanoperedens nitroreducens]MDJ1423357.1 uroporphyrinogen-III synthase [Candidatus Methanoperedens sp.]
MKIAVTKLKEKSGGITELFKQYGHEVFIISTMSAAGPTDPKPLSRLAEMVSEGRIDILIFTSALGVDKLFEKAKPGKSVRIVSVGPKTAMRVEEHGLSSEVITRFSSENFAGYLGDISGKTIGIARAEVQDTRLIESLISGGAIVIEAPAYRLEPAGNMFTDVLKDVDAVIFTSARSFEYSGFNQDHAKNIKVIAIGHKTADAMREYGVVPDIVGNGTLEDCLGILSPKKAYSHS